MATEDETVQRMARAVCFSGYEARCGRCGATPSTLEKCNDWESWTDEMAAALTAIEPGDRLPHGLIVVREEPTEAMLRAGARNPDWIEDPRIAAEITKAYKAMLAAQEDNG